jgi:hypothetical protein
MTDTEVKAPKIEFPATDYPVKVISDTGVGNKRQDHRDRAQTRDDQR